MAAVQVKKAQIQAERAEARSRCSDYARSLQQVIKKFPGGHIFRCFQPDIGGVDSAGYGIASKAV